MPRYWHLERYPGKHVAIDMRTDEVVLVADTPQELNAEIEARGSGTWRRCGHPPRTSRSSKGSADSSRAPVDQADGGCTTRPATLSKTPSPEISTTPRAMAVDATQRSASWTF